MISAYKIKIERANFEIHKKVYTILEVNQRQSKRKHYSKRTDSYSCSALFFSLNIAFLRYVFKQSIILRTNFTFYKSIHTLCVCVFEQKNDSKSTTSAKKKMRQNGKKSSASEKVYKITCLELRRSTVRTEKWQSTTFY